MVETRSAKRRSCPRHCPAPQLREEEGSGARGQGGGGEGHEHSPAGTGGSSDGALYDEEDAGGMRPGALPELPEPQAALPRPTASSGPALSFSSSKTSGR